MPFAEMCLDPEVVILSEVSQTEKKKFHTDIAYMQNLKKNYTKELFYKTETNSQI